MYREHLAVFSKLGAIEDGILEAGERLCETIRRGGEILVCGNGGSAADAQHFAAEPVGRFRREREAWPAIALTADTSIITAIGNDYDFNGVFARQVEGLAKQGDVLIGISTSGRSENVLRAVECARSKGVGTISLPGGDGGFIRSAADLSLAVPSTVTAHIQEAHIFILHAWCAMVETGIMNRFK
ncbi:MAG: SIS domain-containing protein [Syntrophobacteraceae bacterium]